MLYHSSIRPLVDIKHKDEFDESSPGFSLIYCPILENLAPQVLFLVNSAFCLEYFREEHSEDAYKQDKLNVLTNPYLNYLTKSLN